MAMPGSAAALWRVSPAKEPWVSPSREVVPSREIVVASLPTPR